MQKHENKPDNTAAVEAVAVAGAAAIVCVGGVLTIPWLLFAGTVAAAGEVIAALAAPRKQG